jgi:hypothetical protein
MERQKDQHKEAQTDRWKGRHKNAQIEEMEDRRTERKQNDRNTEGQKERMASVAKGHTDR